MPSVAAQNAATRSEIERTAANMAAYPWLDAVLRTRALDLSMGLLVRLHSVPEQGGESFLGLWLDLSRNFWQFDVIVPYDGGAVTVELFENVTGSTIVSAHQRGTGKSFGYLAIQVLEARYGAQSF